MVKEKVIRRRWRLIAGVEGGDMINGGDMQRWKRQYERVMEM